MVKLKEYLTKFRKCYYHIKSRVLGGADIGGAGDAAGGKTWPSAAPAAAKSGQRLT